MFPLPSYFSQMGNNICYICSLISWEEMEQGYSESMDLGVLSKHILFLEVREVFHH